MTKSELQKHFIKSISECGTRHINNIFPEYHSILNELVNEGVLSYENGYFQVITWDVNATW